MRKFFLALIFMLICSATAFAYDNIPVLMYHNTDYVFSKSQALSSITPENFEQHLAAFKENGYNSVSVKDYMRYLEGECDLPAKPLIITFDDGYLSNYRYAMPILAKYGYTASIFVVTGSVGISDMPFPHFTWQQAKEMKESGIFEIYSHTNTHADLTTLSESQLIFEFRRSKHVIESNLGVTCDAFAAPFGKFNDKVIKCAQSAGYKLMMRVGNVSTDAPTEGIVSLKRHTVTGEMSASDVISMMENE